MVKQCVLIFRTYYTYVALLCFIHYLLVIHYFLTKLFSKSRKCRAVIHSRVARILLLIAVILTTDGPKT